MYTQNEIQSFELEQQQQQQHTPSHAANCGPDVDDSGQISEGNGVRGSMGSLGGPRMTPGGEMMYEGHGSLSGVPVTNYTAAQAAAAVHQQQAMAAAAANYRYMTLPSHQQVVANHPQMIPATEYVYATGGGSVGNHIVNQPLIYTSASAAAMAANQAAHLQAQQQQQLQQQSAIQPFDRCPAICSLFAIFCCPITFWCSLPALVYSLCAYTDYRANDMHAYRSKSDVARRCVIIACIVGLILCIIWAILTFLYYGEMLTLLEDIIKVVQKNVWREQ